MAFGNPGTLQSWGAGLLLLATLWAATSDDAELAIPRDGLLHIPLADVLPVSATDVLRFGARDRMDHGTTVMVDKTGGFVLVYASRSDANLSASQLMQAVSVNGTHIGRAQTFRPIEAPLVGSPAFVGSSARSWLYFASADAVRGAPLALWRVERTSAHGWAEAERMEAIPGLDRFLAWPRWSNAGEGVVLSFRDRRSMLNWSKGSTTDGFPNPRLLPGSRGAYAQVVQMPGGEWLASYQRPEEDGHMVTWLQFSEDGDTWSEPEPLFWPDPPRRPEVHDAFALPRADRGVDVYYIHAANRGTAEAPRGAFDLYRRALFGPGQSGPVQKLTTPEGIEPLAPTAHRLASGEVLVSFADILARKNGETGHVVESQLVLFRLPGDAPEQ
jgi:hypothetical protein